MRTGNIFFLHFRAIKSVITQLPMHALPILGFSFFCHQMAHATFDKAYVWSWSIAVYVKSTFAECSATTMQRGDLKLYRYRVSPRWSLLVRCSFFLLYILWVLPTLCAAERVYSFSNVFVYFNSATRVHKH